MKASEWIDRVKQRRGWDSDYRVAQELGVGRATVSKYRRLDSTFDDETAIKVAALLDEEPGVVIIDQLAERTRNGEARAALSRILDRIGGPGLKVAVLAACVALSGLPSRSDAMTRGSVDITSSALYIVSIRRRLRRWLERAKLAPLPLTFA